MARLMISHLSLYRAIDLSFKILIEFRKRILKQTLNLVPLKLLEKVC